METPALTYHAMLAQLEAIRLKMITDGTWVESYSKAYGGIIYNVRKLALAENLFNPSKDTK